MTERASLGAKRIGSPADLPEVQALARRFAAAREAGAVPPFYLTRGPEAIDLTSYDYLDLARDPRVVEAAAQALERHGCSVSGPRILSGEIPLHRQLERRLAEFLGTEDALVLVSGYATNVSVISHLMGRHDHVIHDELVHNSARVGAISSGARRRSFPHNDLNALEERVRAAEGGNVLVLVEGLYSMDGDVPDLPRLLELKDRYGFMLMVDEAHSLGVLGATGRGLSEHFGMARRPDVIWMGTLSKSLASCGGVIAGSSPFIDYLRFSLPAFLYSVGLSPASTAAALAALEVLEAEPQRVAGLRANSASLLRQLQAHGLPTGRAVGAAILPVLVGDEYRCYALSNALQTQGVLVSPIVFPAVAPGTARLRCFVGLRHSAAQLERTAQAVGDLARSVFRDPRS